MTRLRTPGRWIALIAAYAIALQALLPVALAMAAPAEFPICSGSAALAGGKSSDRETGARDCCSVMCCGPVLATPPQPAVLGSRRLPFVVAAAIAPDAFVLPSIRGPQSPRAPPAG